MNRKYLQSALTVAMLLGTLIYVQRTVISSCEPRTSQSEHLTTELPGMYHKFKSRPGNRPTTNIIIVTYMRSGSTLTGNLLEHHPDVFYVFEPFHTLKWIWWSKNARLKFWDQHPRGVKSQEQYSREAIRTANAFLKCHFVDIDIGTLTQHHLSSSNDTKPYANCIKSKEGGILNVLPCLDILYQKCVNSTISVLKTILLPMTAAESMMKSDSSLKVIHLIRDPRPTIRSQMIYGVSTWGELSEYSKKHCDQVEEDLEVTQMLMKRYPGRVQLLLYEDLAKKPLDHVKDLYSFAGLRYSEDTGNYVKSIMSSQTDEKCPICIRTTNSTQKSLEWRGKIDFTRARVIDRNCRSVYSKLGYVAVESAEHLTDLARSLKVKANI